MVATRPKPTAPEHLLDLWMKAKNLFGSDALDSTDYLFGSVHWNALNQKMNMIAIQTDLQKVNFIPLFYFQANILESGRNLCTQYFPPIFD